MSKIYLSHLFFLLLLVITGFIFQLGLSNNFILDDVANLRGLAELQNAPSFSQFINYIFHNTHVNSGRPVSFLFFSIQASDWPNALPFKQFNIYLHLFNGILVYWLMNLLIKRSLSRFVPLLALGITSLWLISPIQVDTVQYVVQRMAMLATTFTLLGLITFVYARTLLSQPRKALFLLYVVFGLCLILAVFSKENGLLLTTLVILIEYSLFKQETRPKFFKLWFFITIILPLVLFTGLVLYRYEHYFFYTYHNFNAYERLLTQQGIILHYISSVLAPSTSKLTLFYDDYPVSKTLFNPPLTFLYLMINVSLIAIAVKSLKKWPLFGIGILFFYLNHIMESTFLPLELYFEHRNYLAVLGLSMSIFSGIYYLHNSIHKPLITLLLKIIPFFLLAISLWINIQQNKIWKAPLYQAYFWYQNHQDSQRAHGHYGMQLNHAGLGQEAVKFYQSTIHHFPGDPTKYLLWLEITCNPALKPAPDKRLVLESIRDAAHYKETIAILNDFIQAFETKRCPGVRLDYFIDIVDSVMNNNNYTGELDFLNLLIIKYRAYQLIPDYKKAAEALEQALTMSKRPDILAALAEKYIYLNKLDKAQATILELKNYCRNHKIKCSNSTGNIKLLQQILETRTHSNKLIEK